MEGSLQTFLLIPSLLLLLLLLHTTSLITAASTHHKVIGVDYGIGALNRTSFPTAFVFGTASSSYQYEGAAFEDGKGPSIWDAYTHKYPGRIANGSNGDVAIDSYHHYKEDVRIMKEMGWDTYVFSFSWPRIIPYGKLSKGVNKRGLQYYHNLIDELLSNGIQPFVTLFHWDLPQFLEEAYGGFLSPQVVDDFQDYADLCFREFGWKVKHWITLNDPYSYSVGGYAAGILAPGRCSDWHCTGGDSATEPYLVAHHLLLSHSVAVQLYRHKYQASQKGKIAIALVTRWMVPYSKTRQDSDAASRALDFMFGWFMDPITHGDYPHSMRSLVGNRLPEFTKEQSMMLKGSYDFLGLNYYTAYYASDYHGFRTAANISYNTDSLVNLTTSRNGRPIGPVAASSWLYVYPRGIYDLLIYTRKRYNNPIIYITENGIDEVNNEKLSLEEALIDTQRIDYHHSHLVFLELAIKQGVDVRGYFAWSLLDNFEWNLGYSVRFGINYVDYKNGLKRHPKLSAKWFKNFLN